MKANIKSVLVLFVILIPFAISSCSEDNESTPANQIIVNDKKFAIHTGYFFKGQVGVDYYGTPKRLYTIYLLGPGMKFDENMQVEGTGEFMYLRLNSTSTEDLTEGTYQMGFGDVAGTAFCLFHEQYTTISAEEYASESGIITIEKKGDAITFIFNLEVEFKDNSGRTIFTPLTGQFAGELIELHN